MVSRTVFIMILLLGKLPLNLVAYSNISRGPMPAEQSEEPGSCLAASVPQLEVSEVAGGKVTKALSALGWAE